MVTVLGKSEPVLTMILDNSNPELLVLINNLDLPNKLPYKNNNTFICEKENLFRGCKNFILGVTKPENKAKLRIKYIQIEDKLFTNSIHSTSSISNTAILGNGLIINSLVSIAGYTNIGNHVTINRNSSIGHHTKIGNYTTINPNCCICGEITIGDYCFIGAGTIITERISICDNVIIGAGSLVRKSINEPGLYVGNPLIKIK